MSHFYTPWKCQKTYGFLAFSGGIEMCLNVLSTYAPTNRNYGVGFGW